MTPAAALSATAPALFIVLWSTGFISAKLGVTLVEPFTFLSLRFSFVIALMLPLAVLWRARWPRTLRETGHIAVAGILMQGGYLSGCFTAMHLGMSAGVIALIMGLQPIVTAFAAMPLLGESVSIMQWVGLTLGFGGVALVVWQKVSLHSLDAVTIPWSLLGLIGITAGALYQKRFCANFDVRTGSVIQFSAALLLVLPVALLTETMNVIWSSGFIVALAWSVLVVSIGAISLFFYLIEHGEATRVSSLFYLAPPTTAAMAYFAFGETLTLSTLAGMIISITGVALVVRKPNLAAPEP